MGVERDAACAWRETRALMHMSPPGLETSVRMTRQVREPGEAGPSLLEPAQNRLVTLIADAREPFAREVELVLTRSRFQMTRSALGARIRRGSLAVLVVSSLKGIAMPVLRGYASATDCVLVTSGEPANLQLLATTPAFCGMVLTSEIHLRLIPTVAACAGTDSRRQLLTLLRDLEGVPGVLLALTRTLIENVDWGHQGPPAVRTIQDASVVVNCSRSYLSRVASQAQVSLPSLLDATRLFVAIERRVATGESWEAIARNIGFASASGLTALCRRVLEITPSSVVPGHLEALKGKILRTLCGPPEKRATPGEFGDSG